MAKQVKKPVGITETILRDAHQSLIATRMSTEQMLPIVEKMDKIGYHSVAKNVEGKTKSANGMHFIYVENTADISQFFSDTRKMERHNELIRKETEEKLAELTAAKKEIAKQIAEARKLMKKCM